LEQRHEAGKSIPPEGAAYHRQYVGFVSKVGSAHHEERFIYGNFYADSEEIRSGWSTFIRANEATQPIMACDGGAVFWGIAYRVSTKTFGDPEFNGGG